MTPELGIIEGFFGLPWSWEERRDAVRFLAPRGYGFYLYAPKADLHLREHWQEAHPVAEFERLTTFAAECRDAGVRFGVGLSPFELHLAAGTEWRAPLAEKLSALSALGLDDLAILFDDMRGDVPELAERQAAIVHFAAERLPGVRLLCCPSYYSDDPVLDTAFGRRPPNYLEDLGRLLDPAIEIMWTGEEVCAREFGVGHLKRVGELLGRKPFLWDNYPVNDGARMSRHLHLRAFTGRPAGIAPHISGHGINPASQAMLSRIPALTLVRSYADGEAYEYGAAFEAAAREVLGDELGERVRGHLLTLQDRGLHALGPLKAKLRERYAAYDHPAAQEIVQWLDGRWHVEDALVQTQ